MRLVYQVLMIYSINTDTITTIIIKREYMNVIVNGESREFKSESTLLEILKELSLEGKVMAAAVNMEIVKQDSWNTYKLNDGDKLELLDFVGGG